MFPVWCGELWCGLEGCNELAVAVAIHHFSCSKSVFLLSNSTHLHSLPHSFYLFLCTLISHVASEVLSVTDEDLTAISFLLDAEDEVRDVMML